MRHPSKWIPGITTLFRSARTRRGEDVFSRFSAGAEVFDDPMQVTDDLAPGHTENDRLCEAYRTGYLNAPHDVDADEPVES